MTDNRRYLAAKALEKRYQMRVNSLAERADMTPDNPEYKDAAERLVSIGQAVDDFEAENRVTDEQGKLLKPPVTRLPVVSDPSKDTSGFNYHFEPSVTEVQEALRSNPRLLQELDPLGEWSRIAEAERQEDVADPMSGYVGGTNTVAARTYLDNLTDQDSLYKRYADRMWEQRMEEARKKGQGVQRYRDIHFEDGQKVDYLAGGLEYNIDRRLAPAALGAADSVSFGIASPYMDTVRDLYEYELGKYGVDVDFPRSSEVINRSPGSYVVGNLGGYAVPGNPSNLLQAGAAARLGYGAAGRFGGSMLGKAAISAGTGAAVNVAEGAIGDYTRALGQGQGLGEAAVTAGENVLPNAGFGAAAGGLFDAAGQAADMTRRGFRKDPDMRALKTLEEAGGRTDVLRGVVAPDQVNQYIDESLIHGNVGSPAAIAAQGVAGDIDQSLTKQSIDEGEAIKARKEEYFNHPAYRDIQESGQPAIQGLVDLAGEGWVAGPVTGAPRNMNMEQVDRIGKMIREYTDVPQVVNAKDAQAFADEWGGVVIDGELGNRLYGLDEKHAAPPGYAIVAVPLPMNARNITQLEDVIDEQLNMGKTRGRTDDAVWNRMNERVKEVRDKFPLWEDEAGNLVAPPGWQDPNAPKPAPEGPVYEGEFVESSRPARTDLEPRGPDTEPMGPPPPPPGGPRLPPNGGLPAGDDSPLARLAGRGQRELPPGSDLEGVSVPQNADDRGALERMLDAGLDRPDAPALPVSEIEDAALRQQVERDRTAEAWRQNEGPTRKWFEDILAPGREARSGETKRMMDLTEQQRAMEEAMGTVNNIDKRLGPIEEGQKKQMLADLISKKLGRKVTVADLVKAGLIASGVGAMVSGDADAEQAGAGAAVVGLGAILGKSKNVNEIVERVSKVTADAVKRLTPEEKQAITEWSNSSRQYKQSYERVGRTPEENAKKLKELGYKDEQIAKHKGRKTFSAGDEANVKALDGAMNKLAIHQPTDYGPLYRGFSAGDRMYDMPDIESLRKNGTFINKTPISTSYNARGADDFTVKAFDKPDQTPVILEFARVNRAAPRVHPDLQTLGGDARMREAEVIIPPGSTFKVVGRKTKKVYRYPEGHKLHDPKEFRDAEVFVLEQVEDAPRSAWTDAAMIAATLGVGAGASAVADDDDSGAAAGGAVGAMAVMGRRRGKGGGKRTPPTEPPKYPRQPEMTLENGRVVRGFSALRQRQHEALNSLERSRARVGANDKEPVVKRVMGFEQGPDANADKALLEEAKKIGKEDELRMAAATSVYPQLRKRSFFLGGQGWRRGAADFAGLHGDKILEYMSGRFSPQFERNPFQKTPPGTMEDLMREFFNVTGGRQGARHGDDFRRIWEALYGNDEEENQPSP